MLENKIKNYVFIMITPSSDTSLPNIDMGNAPTGRMRTVEKSGKGK